jgi:hypothetical protein
MLQTMTRPRAIRTWFVAVALIIVATIAIGVQVTISTAATLLALCLVPPLAALFLWPAARPRTVPNVLHESDRHP